MENPRHRVLVVDDEPENLSFYGRVLRNACDVVAAPDGKSAIGIAREQPFSLVVTDQRMPGLTGTAMLAELQTFMPRVPKIVVTAYEDIDPILLAVNSCGLFGYLLKPVTAGDLTALVQRALREYEAHLSMRDAMERLERENQQLAAGNAELREAASRMQATQAQLGQTIQALRTAYERMAAVAQRDPVTQLQDRAHFMRALETELERSRRYRRPASLVLLDVAGFKRIAERWGAAVADATLLEVAEQICRAVRANDRVFRVGPDDFAVILPESDVAAGNTVAAKLAGDVAARLPDTDETARVRAASWTAAPDAVHSAEEWYALADADLYYKKRGGG